MIGAVEQFLATIRASGLNPPAEIEPGRWYKFPGHKKNLQNRAAWCYLFDDHRGGVFGDFSSGKQSHWSAVNAEKFTLAEREAESDRVKGLLVKRCAEQAARHESAAVDADRSWQAAVLCTGHPYLTAKGVQPYDVRVNSIGDLIVPVRDTSSNLRSLQTIKQNGQKLFLSGGQVKSCIHMIGKPGGGVLIVCEGYATGASLHEATGHAVAVAFNAGNLEAVALEMRTKNPALLLIVAADDDYLTVGNPGMTKARAAAQGVDGMLAIPDFGVNRQHEDTDFNDLHQRVGLKAVRRCIEAAKKLPPEKSCAWPDPTLLSNALPPVQPFYADLLPVALRGWVMDISYRMQCPPDFPAVAALVALSSLIGGRAVVQPKALDDWRVTPNLWGMAVGRPGVKKSPALSEALKPLNQLQDDAFERWQDEHKAWTLDCKLAGMQGDANEKKAKRLAANDPEQARALLAPVGISAEPTARRYIVNDVTVEKLGELMQKTPWGTLSYRDELYGLLTGMDKQGQEGARAFYLQSYDGNQGYTFDRIGRGTVHIRRVCLAMIGGIQPGRIQEYVRGAVAGGSADDGLLQRFSLTVWPDTDGEFVHVDQLPDTLAKQTAWAVFERLAELLPASDIEPQIWRFSSEAQTVFVQWLVPFEKELRSDELHPAMLSHLSKYRKLIPALALVFALIDTPDAGGVIGERELIRALDWGNYLRTHAYRLYATAVTPETTGAAALLAKIKGGKLADRDGVLMESFTPRQVAQKCWTGLGTPEAVRKAADLLQDYGWLVREVQQTGGRPSECYLINPTALARGGHE